MNVNESRVKGSVAGYPINKPERAGLVLRPQRFRALVNQYSYSSGRAMRGMVPSPSQIY